MYRKGMAPYFALAIAAFLVVLLVAIFILKTSSGNITEFIECSLGLYQFTGGTGCPG